MSKDDDKAELLKAEENLQKLGKQNQFIGALTISFATMSLGTVGAYVTVTLPQLQCVITHNDVMNETCKPVLDEEAGSWFASLEFLTGVFLCPLGGFLSGKIGRRMTLLVTTPLLIVGFSILAISKTTAFVFIGWILCSSTVNMNFSSAGVYVAEFAHPTIRANLNLITAFAIAVGQAMVLNLEAFLDYRQVSWILIVPPSLVMLMLFWLPESPFWLVKADKTEEAKKALQFYRGPDFNIDDEFNIMVEQDAKDKKKAAEEETNWKTTAKKIGSPTFLKPYSIIGVLYVLLNLAGWNVITSYMVEILQSSGSIVPKEVVPPIYGNLALVIAGIMPFVVGYVKPVLFFCAGQVVNTIATAGLGVAALVYSNHLKNGGTEGDPITSTGWIPVTSIVLQSIMRSVGIFPVLRPLLMEVYPMEIRTLGIGLTQSTFIFTGFVAVKSFKAVEGAIGLSGLSFFWAVINAIIGVYGYFVIPDNRGKTLGATSGEDEPPPPPRKQTVRKTKFFGDIDIVGDSDKYGERSKYTFGLNARSNLRFAHTNSIYM